MKQRRRIAGFWLAWLMLIATEGHTGPRASQVDADDKELASYRLSMDKVRKLVEFQRAVNKAAAADPGLRKRVTANDSPSGESIAEMVRRLESEPKMAAITRSVGTTPKDLVLTTISLMQVAMVVQLRKVGAPPPKELQAGLAKANLDLWRANSAEIERLMEEHKQLQRELRRKE